MVLSVNGHSHSMSVTEYGEEWPVNNQPQPRGMGLSVHRSGDEGGIQDDPSCSTSLTPCSLCSWVEVGELQRDAMVRNE